MDIGNAVRFVFEDEEWITKILLGIVITLIPIFGGFALAGYVVAIIRNVMAGNPRPLPAWDNLGRYFMDGLMFWIVTFIYALPLFILLCPVALVWVLPAFGGEQENLTALLAGISGIVAVGLGCLAALYGILLALLTPALQIRYAETGEIGACLRFGETFRFLFDNIGGIIISQLLVWVAGMILIPVASTLTLGLLILPISVWLSVFSGHLYGQIGQQAGVTSLVV